MPRPRCERPEWVKTKKEHLSEQNCKITLQRRIGQSERNHLHYKEIETSDTTVGNIIFSLILRFVTLCNNKIYLFLYIHNYLQSYIPGKSQTNKICYLQFSE